MDTFVTVVMLLSALCVPLWVVLRVRESLRRRDELRERAARGEDNEADKRA